MKLSDMKQVEALERMISDCDFYLRAAASSRLRIWVGDRGAILETYGDRFRFLPQDFVERLSADITAEIEKRKEEAVAALSALGVDAAA